MYNFNVLEDIEELKNPGVPSILIFNNNYDVPKNFKFN